MKQITELDERAFMWIVSHQYTQLGKKLPNIFRLISKTADGYLYPFILLGMFLVDDTYGYLLVYTAFMAYALEVPIYLLLKHVFKRPRPCDIKFKLHTFVVPADKFSLPSGHTAAAFLMATLVSFYYPEIAIFAFIWATAVGISRIVLRVHYPSDVLIGAALGVSISLLSIGTLH